MKIPNKRELQQTALNNSSDIKIQRLYESLQKRFSAKLYLFLVIDSTLASDIPLCFRKDLLERT